MTNKAFLMLNATRVEAGPVREVAGALQQESRLFDGDHCVCVLLVTFPPGSPAWESFHAGRTLDSMPSVRNDSICSDAQEAAAGVPRGAA